MAASAISAGPGSDDYLTEVCRLLWPPPASTTLISRRSARLEQADRELIVLPGGRRPKLIVPGGRRAASAAVRRYGEPGSAKTMLATRALAILLAAGPPPAPGDRLGVRVPCGARTIRSPPAHPGP